MMNKTKQKKRVLLFFCFTCLLLHLTALPLKPMADTGKEVRIFAEVLDSVQYIYENKNLAVDSKIIDQTKSQGNRIENIIGFAEPVMKRDLGNRSYMCSVIKVSIDENGLSKTGYTGLGELEAGTLTKLYLKFGFDPNDAIVLTTDNYIQITFSKDTAEILKELDKRNDLIGGLEIRNEKNMERALINTSNIKNGVIKIDNSGNSFSIGERIFLAIGEDNFNRDDMYNFVNPHKLFDNTNGVIAGTIIYPGTEISGEIILDLSNLKTDKDGSQSGQFFISCNFPILTELIIDIKGFERKDVGISKGEPKNENATQGKIWISFDNKSIREKFLGYIKHKKNDPLTVSYTPKTDTDKSFVGKIKFIIIPEAGIPVRTILLSIMGIAAAVGIVLISIKLFPKIRKKTRAKKVKRKKTPEKEDVGQEGYDFPEDVKQLFDKYPLIRDNIDKILEKLIVDFLKKPFINVTIKEIYRNILEEAFDDFFKEFDIENIYQKPLEEKVTGFINSIDIDGNSKSLNDLDIKIKEVSESSNKEISNIDTFLEKFIKAKNDFDEKYNLLAKDHGKVNDALDTTHEKVKAAIQDTVKFVENNKILLEYLRKIKKLEDLEDLNRKMGELSQKIIDLENILVKKVGDEIEDLKIIHKNLTAEEKEKQKDEVIECIKKPYADKELQRLLLSYDIELPEDMEIHANIKLYTKRPIEHFSSKVVNLWSDLQNYYQTLENFDEFILNNTHLFHPYHNEQDWIPFYSNRPRIDLRECIHQCLLLLESKKIVVCKYDLYKNYREVLESTDKRTVLAGLQRWSFKSFLEGKLDQVFILYQLLKKGFTREIQVLDRNDEYHQLLGDLDNGIEAITKTLEGLAVFPETVNIYEDKEADLINRKLLNNYSNFERVSNGPGLPFPENTENGTIVRIKRMRYSKSTTRGDFWTNTEGIYYAYKSS